MKMKLSELKKLIREVIKEQRLKKKSNRPRPTGTNRLWGGGGNKAPMKGDRPTYDFNCGTNPNGPGCPGYNPQNCCQQVYGQSPMQTIVPGPLMGNVMPCYTLAGQYLGSVTAKPVNGVCLEVNTNPGNGNQPYDPITGQYTGPAT